ncbi:MAG: hypothetical protein PHQ27_02270 [Victivallales bacterium]|nr:hypothetical protein [Victivallales bacterium]
MKQLNRYFLLWSCGIAGLGLVVTGNAETAKTCHGDCRGNVPAAVTGDWTGGPDCMGGDDHGCHGNLSPAADGDALPFRLYRAGLDRPISPGTLKYADISAHSPPGGGEITPASEGGKRFQYGLLRDATTSVVTQDSTTFHLGDNIRIGYQVCTSIGITAVYDSSRDTTGDYVADRVHFTVWIKSQLQRSYDGTFWASGNYKPSLLRVDFTAQINRTTGEITWHATEGIYATGGSRTLGAYIQISHEGNTLAVTAKTAEIHLNGLSSRVAIAGKNSQEVNIIMLK